jgi:vacuolar-type H+-ATPase subunit H
MVFVFKEYFNVSNLLVESLILYSLRNIFLGAMGFYGMALNENMILQKEVESLKAKNANVDRIIDDAKKEASIIVADAKIKAERLIFEAQKNSTNVVEMKNKIERNLKQFIQTERELIRKYEKEDF